MKLSFFCLAHYFGLQGMLSRVTAGEAYYSWVRGFFSPSEIVFQRIDQNLLSGGFSENLFYVQITLQFVRDVKGYLFPDGHWFPSLTTAYRALNSMGSTQEVLA